MGILSFFKTNENSSNNDVESNVLKVILIDSGNNKLIIIKALREILGKGLKETIDMVDSIPILILETKSINEANNIAEKLEKAGGVVKIEEVLKISQIENSLSKIEIPMLCPHCKSPNSKLEQICEWCGGNIY
ncbi:MAG: ribosomal protein L7/L12 [Candidatus Kapabacteria bacterium]|nr:ribosomal protein L7/L12 [Candidatus Kapabacteria bacterium]